MSDLASKVSVHADEIWNYQAQKPDLPDELVTELLGAWASMKSLRSGESYCSTPTDPPEKAPPPGGAPKPDGAPQPAVEYPRLVDVDIDGKKVRHTIAYEHGGQTLVIPMKDAYTTYPPKAIERYAKKTGKLPADCAIDGCVDITKSVLGRVPDTRRFYLREEPDGKQKVFELEVVDFQGRIDVFYNGFDTLAIKTGSATPAPRDGSPPDTIRLPSDIPGPRDPHSPWHADDIVTHKSTGKPYIVGGMLDGKVLVHGEGKYTAASGALADMPILPDGTIPPNYCPKGAIDVTEQVKGRGSGERAFLFRTPAGDTLHLVKTARQFITPEGKVDPSGPYRARVKTVEATIVGPTEIAFDAAMQVGYDKTTQCAIFTDEGLLRDRPSCIPLSKEAVKRLQEGGEFRKVTLKMGAETFDRYRRIDDPMGVAKYYSLKLNADGSGDLIQDQDLFERHRPEDGNGTTAKTEPKDRPPAPAPGPDVKQPTTEELLTREDGDRVAKQDLERGKQNGSGEIKAVVDTMDTATKKVFDEIGKSTKRMLAQIEEQVKQIPDEAKRKHWEQVLKDARGENVSAEVRDAARQKLATVLAKTRAAEAANPSAVGGRAVRIGTTLIGVATLTGFLMEKLD